MHSLVIVVGDKPLSEMMEPFDLTLAVPKYVVGPVSDNDKEEFINFYNEHTEGYHFRMDDFDKLYAEKGDSWNERCWEKGENGVWVEVSYLNQDGRWDWYEVGGRWAGWLELKGGVERMEPLNFSWDWDRERRTRTNNENPCRADVAYLKDIDKEYLNIMKAGDILINGEWIGLGGYEFGFVKPYLEGLPDDTLITCVDYHC